MNLLTALSIVIHATTSVHHVGSRHTHSWIPVSHHRIRFLYGTHSTRCPRIYPSFFSFIWQKGKKGKGEMEKEIEEESVI
ncbi:uncharacterized protein BDW43DRAFT_269731 [Aspergillus alliaceus]|uniref:uncharacterized protein n=1 Tax=Petromyces alliaceus TaxID=209559 RepID=UPI0012A5F11D|nr:uncharacterized protein BDW43DRAFT_269731 [Aspergillus alliaceus]KAB8235829.1 hypothetical protein BDW43DRAFT_269731 [Aspergillus alliaceus]